MLWTLVTTVYVLWFAPQKYTLRYLWHAKFQTLVVTFIRSDLIIWSTETLKFISRDWCGWLHVIYKYNLQVHDGHIDRMKLWRFFWLFFAWELCMLVLMQPMLHLVLHQRTAAVRSWILNAFLHLCKKSSHLFGNCLVWQPHQEYGFYTWHFIILDSLVCSWPRLSITFTKVWWVFS